MTSEVRREPSIGEILTVVARYSGVTVHDLVSDRRAAKVSRPRQVAMYLAYELTSHSIPTIARHIGRRDHTTITYGIARTRDRMRADPALRERVERLSERLAPTVPLIVMDEDFLAWFDAGLATKREVAAIS